MPRRGPTIADGALELIRARGPQTPEELASVIAERGLTKAKDPVAAVRAAIAYHSAFIEGPGGRYYSLADQLEGAVFAVRPTEFERRNEMVLMRDDLALIERLLAGSRSSHDPVTVHLAFFADHFDLPYWDVGVVDVDEDGEPVIDPDVRLRDEISDESAQELFRLLEELGIARGEDDEAHLRDLLWETRGLSVLRGPRGWLPALRSRELLGLRVESGAVRAVAVDRREITGIHVEAAANRIARLVDEVLEVAFGDQPHRAVRMELVLAILVTEAPELLRRPLPPLVEVVRGAGYEVDGGWIGSTAALR